VHRTWDTLRTFGSSHTSRGVRYAPSLRTANAFQERHKLLNSSFTPRVRPHADGTLSLDARLYRSIKDRAQPTQDVRKVWRWSRAAHRAVKQGLHPLWPWCRVQSGHSGLYLSVRGEQAPNPQSRVRLTSEHDVLGMPRVALDWRFSEIDKRTLRVLVAELDAQMRRDDAGHVEPAPWLSDPDLMWEHDPLMSHHPIGGYHHMGTTRMSNDPRFGVVDANCRVHGVSNLHVAGSSVFPTSGWANPTLTIVALALRLADHLLHLMSRPAPGVTTTRAPMSTATATAETA
jgi:choline dehydrogenase-like flavoprotein